MTTTITLSSKGQFALPKELRNEDELESSDVFRLQRVGRGRYFVEKLAPAKLPKAKLVKDKDGLPVFKCPPGSPTTPHELVKRLESETI
jgi:bifunctional DNA-binding transcriptional regulator/antitoxin component of YhaV-PrlF toxin-antitoxin module